MANAINSIGFGDNKYVFTLPYGVCETAAATAAKVLTVDNFSLETGATVIVKFKYANSVASPTLNVNGTGAKPIYRYGTTAASTGTTSTGWIAGAVQMFTYDGTGWIRDYWNNSTYSNAGLGQGYGTCSTAASTVAKVVSLSSYALTSGGVVSVKFTYAVPAGATMNINSKGAKAIYYRGSAIIAGIIEAGDIATFIYDGTQYHLLTVDRHRFFTMLVPYGVSINSTEDSPVDLNTTEFLKVGNYYCSTNAKAKTLENCPTTVAFMMQVYSPLSTEIDNETSKAYIYRVRKLLTYTGLEYIQYCSVGATAGEWTYGAWKQVVTTPTAGTAVGSATKPIYINSSGVPTAVPTAFLTEHPTISTSDDTTNNVSVGHGESFDIISAVTRDGNGHVKTLNTKTVKLPAAYTHPSYTARTGVPTANQTPAFGGTFSVSQITSDATGHVTGTTSRTITIPSTAATTSKAGLMSAADKTKLNGLTAYTYSTTDLTAGTSTLETGKLYLVYE